MERVIIISALSILLTGCATAPVPVLVNATQTEIASTGATVAGDIATVKEITDVAKITGEIPKESVPTVIKYVDKAHDDVAELNKLIEKQTKNISTMTIEIDKYKEKASIYFKWALIASLVVLVLGLLLFAPKPVKLF